MECLLEGVHLVPIHRAKQVCKRWKCLIESARFALAYKAMVILVQEEETPWDWNRQFCYQIKVQGRKTIWQRELGYYGLEGITSHINGLMIAYNTKEFDGPNYICNVSLDKQEKIPNPPAICLRHQTGIFNIRNGRRDGRYKLVLWSACGAILTLTSGETEWSDAVPSSNYDCKQLSKYPVAMGNSMFRVRQTDGILMEYNLILGHLSLKPIRSKDQIKTLNFSSGFKEAELMVWEDRLYLLMVHSNEKLQTVDIWQMSTSDGSVAHVDQIETKARATFFTFENELLHIRRLSDTEVLVTYNMVNRSVQKGVYPYSEYPKIMTVAVTLADYSNICKSRFWRSLPYCICAYHV